MKLTLNRCLNNSLGMKLERNILIIFIVVALCVDFGKAATQKNSSGVVAFSDSVALNMAQEWASLVSQANVPGLEKLLSGNYIHIHGTALVENKIQFLEAFRNGIRKYDPIKLEEVVVRVFGNSAIVTGKFNLRALVRGKAVEGVNRFGLVLANTEEGQQVVSFQATAVPLQNK